MTERHPYGRTSFAAIISGGGIQFEYIDMGNTDILQNKTAFTIEFRLNNTYPAHAATYFAQQDGDDDGIILMERYFGDNYIRIGGEGMARWVFEPEEGDWHHYAIVFDGNGANNNERLKIYLDGQLQTVDQWIGNIPPSTPAINEKFFIGCKHYGMNVIGQDIEGQYEEFRIWDKALDNNEIIEIINYGANGTEENLVGFFSFNEGDASNFIGTDASITTVGVSEEISPSNMQLYPNPSMGQFTIELTETSQIQITTSTGKLIYEANLGAGIRTIDLTRQAEGVYFVKAKSTNKQQTIKVLVQ
ncbi:MAG: hypothetical protein B6I19_10915 [Bacteroidetes bacterium 4572_114]|nr:MAG: hypothetical protein B6I19_10915 [Bacteroidetes bacterium 4572_114]